MNTELIRKYNVPGPRYTSYPTVPYWDEKGITPKEWTSSLRTSLKESKNQGISLYIHLPFCESLCTFCGCNKRITKRHEVEDPYIATLLKEWRLYLDMLPYSPKIEEIHLGGGTPTFFDPANLQRLIEGILTPAEKSDIAGFSLEGHPNNTTKEHLQVLYDLGFRRVSFGVQDYDPKVQLAINRVQPFENVQKVHEWSRDIGYTSINHDLVFGLPHQTKEGVEHTIAKTLELLPDRIAFYSYAHVPWIKGTGQRGFDENDLPRDAEKRILYETGKELFDQNGYVEIGMDHFARKSDSLFRAMADRTLNRNFMGYTTTSAQVLIGLGVSAISDSWYAFAQNEKKLEDYQERVENGELAMFKGHVLSHEDLKIRRHILNIMCQFKTEFNGDLELFKSVKPELEELEKDGLIDFSDNAITVSEKGRPFVRNVCMALDLKLQRNKPDRQIFSKTV